MEEQLQISSSAIKTKIAGLLGQLRRELGKTKAKKSGQALANYKSQWLYWDRLEFLVAVMQAGKSEEKRQNVEIKIEVLGDSLLINIGDFLPRFIQRFLARIIGIFQ